LLADLIALRRTPIEVFALFSNGVQVVRGGALTMDFGTAPGAKRKLTLWRLAARASLNFQVGPSIGEFKVKQKFPMDIERNEPYSLVHQ